MPISQINQNSLASTASFYGMKNRIINGAMVIDQRNAGASVTPTVSAYSVDRWVFNISQASKFSFQQNAGSVTPPVGFTKYLGVTSLSNYSVLSTDNFVLNQWIEGYNIADLGWGTANAKTVTLSFQVYSSLTGTFGGSLQGYNGSTWRSYPFNYSIPVANTWTTISVTVAGDTTAFAYSTTNSYGINVSFSLGAGSTYSGTANAFTASQISQPTGSVSIVGTSGATFYITGVQLEQNTVASNFDFRPYGTELALCQRYYEIRSLASGTLFGTGYALGTSAAGIVIPAVAKRATPSTSYSGALYVLQQSGATQVTSLGSPLYNIYANEVYQQFNTTVANLTAGTGIMMYANAGVASFSMSSEL